MINLLLKNFSTLSTNKMQQFSKLVDNIKINPNEQEIFDIFLGFVKDNNLKTTLRVAGGWVRDKLLGMESHDIDIALDDMMGEQFVKQMNEYLVNKYNEKSHGFGVTKFNPDKSKHLETACVKIKDVWIDVVNLRGETYSEQSRIPQMTIGTPFQDAERRDLTINALYYNLNECKIEDFTGKGLSDLQNGIIRTPLDPVQTFMDDPLRVLRTFRFTSRFKYDIVPEIYEALKNKDIKENLRIKVSRERFGIEITSILNHPNAFDALLKFYENDLWDIVFELPTACELKKEQAQKYDRVSFMICDQVRTNFDKIEQYKTLQGKYDTKQINFFTIISAIVFPYYEIQYKQGKNHQSVAYHILLDSLKFPKKETTSTIQIIESAKKFDILKRQNLEEKFDDLVTWIQEAGGSWELSIFIQYCAELVNDPKTSYDLSLKTIQFIYDKQIHQFYDEKPLVNGGEISKLLSVQPGPQIKVVIGNILLWQARNRSGSKDELITFLQNGYK